MDIDREKTLQRLNGLEQQVALGERHVAEQRALIEKLEREGHDVKSATSLLATLEESQRLHVEHRDRLEKEFLDSSRP
jgi:hypothetical protein